MKKPYLQDVIGKYYLGGLVERVKIQITDKTLTTKFISTQKNLVGVLEAPNVTLKDCEFGVYDTSQLLKLIGITDHFLTLDVEETKGIANKLLIADNEYNLEYALADTMLTPSVPSIDEPTYHMVADVNTEFIARFLKAKKALDTDVFMVEQIMEDTDEKPAIKFTLGGNDNYTNKINFTLQTTLSSIPGAKIKFPIAEFGEILAANKEIAIGVLSVSEDGLLKIDFTNEEGVKVTYLLVGKE
jgi:hypothetical protein